MFKLIKEIIIFYNSHESSTIANGYDHLLFFPHYPHFWQYSVDLLKNQLNYQLEFPLVLSIK